MEIRAVLSQSYYIDETSSYNKNVKMLFPLPHQKAAQTVPQSSTGLGVAASLCSDHCWLSENFWMSRQMLASDTAPRQQEGARAEEPVDQICDCRLTGRVELLGSQGKATVNTHTHRVLCKTLMALCDLLSTLQNRLGIKLSLALIQLQNKRLGTTLLNMQNTANKLQKCMSENPFF